MFSKNTIIFIGLAALSVRAQEFDNNDVPQQCRSVCQAMIDAARTCDQQNSGDRAEVDCICSTENASFELPACAACVRQYDRDDDDDDNDENDVDEVVRSCGFSSTTFNPSSTGSATTSSTGSNRITSSASRSLTTSTFVTTSTDFDDDPDDQDETRTLTRTTVFAADATPASNAGQSGTSAVGGAVDSASSGAADAVNSATSSVAGDSASAQSDSGAVATGLPILGAGAGALVAALGLL